MLEDITERKRAEEELRAQAELNEHQALHDALTGLPNRTLFRDRDRAGDPSRAQREGDSVAVMLIDLDRFKEVNDTLGHHAGDDAAAGRSRARLAGVAARLATRSPASAATSSPCCSRDVPTADDVRRVIDRIARGARRSRSCVDGLPLAVEALASASPSTRSTATTSDTLLQRADVAMYVAKESSSAYAFYDASADHHDPAA